MPDKHEFVTKTGEVYEFDTEQEMTDFGISYAIGNLVAEGYGELVMINGEETFKINEKGLQHFKELSDIDVH